MQATLLEIGIIQIVLLGALATYVIKWRNSTVVGWLVNLNLINSLLLLFNFLAKIRVGILNKIVGFVFIFLMAAVIFSLIFSFVFLFVNAWFVLKREGWGSSSLLVLFAGIAVIAVDVFMFYSPRRASFIFEIIGFLSLAVIFYFLFTFWNTLMSITVYNWYFPKPNKDYIIVLGSGLVDGEKVGRLLGNRIDKGISFYHEQLAKNNYHAKLVFSGGQGPDEKIPEGLAMQRYAVAKGVPVTDTLVEDRSTTTRENLIYSDQIIKRDSGRSDNRVVFVSNNYHILRAGILAGKLKIKATGIGAKTPFYYLPTATIREYLALFVMHKWFHTFALSLVLLGALILIIPLLINH